MNRILLFSSHCPFFWWIRQLKVELKGVQFEILVTRIALNMIFTEESKGLKLESLDLNCQNTCRFCWEVIFDVVGGLTRTYGALTICSLQGWLTELDSF
jgi:hypothetical protein